MPIITSDLGAALKNALHAYDHNYRTWLHRTLVGDEPLIQELRKIVYNLTESGPQLTQSDYNTLAWLMADG